MTPRVLSLRARLTAIILAPLLAIGTGIAVWAVIDAQTRADTRFDRALLTAALAVSRDVAVSGGDALSPDTSALLRDTSGGQVFYHVYAPDGVFVTGYATPPVPVSETFIDSGGQQFYEGVYQQRSVRAVRFVDAMELEGLTGNFTITVWQDATVRTAFVRDLVQFALIATLGLIAAVAFIVWFGVRLGLRPLLDLEQAIERRSIDDLSPIKRAVPVEVAGISRTLNRLFEQVSRGMTAQAEFIANAAHQLRNPIAGVLALAEAVDKAKTFDDSKARSKDLLEAAQQTALLSQQLLTLERAKALSPASKMTTFDLAAALDEWTPAESSAAVTVAAGEGLEAIHGDPTMLREALRNLLDNAVRHGGPELSEIRVRAARAPNGVEIAVRDDGQGVRQSDMDKLGERFRQGAASGSGSGLGLSIVEAVARGHGGTLELRAPDKGFEAILRLPT